MSKIEKLIAKFCPNGAEWKQLGEFCEIKTGKGITKIQGNINGLYPIISGGKQPMGYFDFYNRDANNVTISRVGANAGFVSFIKDKFYLNDKCFSVIPKDVLNKKYLFYYLKNYEDKIIDMQSEGGVPTINTQKVAGISIPIPPLPVQEEIVKILDKFTQLEAELEAELEARTRQYEYYRNQLLAFEGKKVEWKTLGQVASSQLAYGSGASAVDYFDNIRYIRITDIKDDGNLIVDKKSPSEIEEKYILNDGDILIARSGATVGKTFHYKKTEEKAIYAGYLIRFVADKKQVLSKYVYHFTKSNLFTSFVENNKSTGSQPNINAKQYSSIKIPIPSFEEQERIVKILDQFDALVNDISVGLPAEIKARRAQYEYYRGKLLTFQPLVHS